MGIELLRFPQFHRSILEASDYLKKLGCSWDLREELEKPAAKSRINEPEYSQPICTAFQIALLALLDLTGIKPVAVLGHSSGEIAAAYCKGAISRESALKIAYFRGLIAKELTHMPSYDGTMIAVGLSEQDARPVLWQLAEAGHTDLHIACINSPSNVTISGSTRCIDAMQKLLHKSGTFARVLKVNIAYHSPHMNSVAARYRGLLEGIVPSDHIITSPIMCSSVTGEMVDGEELLQPDYWVSNLVSPVRFTDSLAQVGKFFKKEQVKKLDLSHRGKASITNIVEIGPHGALKAPIRDTLRQYTDQEIDHQSLITRNNSAIDTFLSAIGNLSCSGIEVSLDSINNTDGVKALQALVDLPCYPFNHSRSYWQESQQSKGLRLRRQKRLELLGAPVPNWNPLSATWRNFLDQSKSPWLKDHKINNTCVYPAAGMLSMAIEAMGQYLIETEGSCAAAFNLRDVDFHAAMRIPDEPGILETQIRLQPQGDSVRKNESWFKFRIYICEGDQWKETCRGSIRPEYEVDSIRDYVPGRRQSHTPTQEISIQDFYSTLTKSGYHYGPAFRRVRRLWRENSTECRALVNMYDSGSPGSSHIIHPTTLDTFLHMPLANAFKKIGQAVPTMIPTRIRKLWLSAIGLNHSSGDTLSATAWQDEYGYRGGQYSVTVNNLMGESRLKMRGYETTLVSGGGAEGQMNIAQEGPQTCWTIGWKPSLQFLHDQKLTMIQLLDILNHEVPTLRVLELCGGTGSLASHILQLLNGEQREAGAVSRYSRYDFANQSFLVNGLVEKQLAGFPNVNHLALDITEAHAHQRFDGGPYDLIILSQVPPTTIQTDSTLSNISLLLVPGGKLLLAEQKDQTHIQTTKDLLVKYNFQATGNKVEHPLGSTEVFMLAYKSAEAVSQSSLKFEIITGGSSSQERFAASLQERLSITGCAICIGNIREAATWSDSVALSIVICDLDEPSIWASMTDEEFSTIRKLITARNKVLWVYGNLNSSNNAPHDRTVDGLSRVLRREQTMSTFTTLALRSTETTARVEIITRVAEALTQKMDEYQLEQAYEEDEDGNICIARLKDNAKLNKNMEVLSTGPVAMLHPFGLQPLEIKIGTLGMLDTMYFTLDPIYKQPLGDNEIEIEVQAAGLNFKDCLIALGQLNENSIGLECAGTVKSIGKDTSGHGLLPGDRVCGFCHKAYRTYVRGNGAHFSRIPDSLSFAEAASIPINFATAWHSLHVVGRLQAGETILVHSGAGGTGQAAIQIARLVGATVFATVGTAEKRQLLIEKYNIPDNHIFSSRDPSFVDNIQRVTRGRGVDMVLNSTSGDMLFGSWECIAPYGRFIELGKRDIQAQKGLPMLQFERNCSFSAVDLGAMFKEKPRRVKTTLDNVLVEFNKGTLSPVYSIHQFKVSEITDAFRAMQTGKVSGKIVITMSPGDMVPAIVEEAKETLFTGDDAYIIAGGLGGLGREITRWMARRGAKKFILLSRSAATTGTAIAFLAEMASAGVKCIAPACDISDATALQATLDKLPAEMQNIKGCIQATMVLQNRVFSDMTFNEWKDSLKAKVAGSWNLHSLLPQNLDFFIFFSSIQGIVGARGQANYAAANAFQDALARLRVSQGMKSVSLDLGAVETDGFLSENHEELELLRAQNTYRFMSRAELLVLMEYICDPKLEIKRPEDAQVVLGLNLLPANKSLDPPGTSWAENPFFRPIRRQTSVVTQAQGMEGTTGESFRAQLMAAETVKDATNLITKALIHRLASSILRLEPEDVDDSRSIQAYGVDSLQTMELRSWFLRFFAADIPTFEILGATSLAALAAMIAERSGLRKKS